MADGKDDQVPDPAGRATCTECGGPLAPDQRYCLNCGARRGRLPGAVGTTMAAVTAQGRGIAAAAGGFGSKPKGDGAPRDGGRSWMPSPPAIAIAVIGMLALGVGIGSAMSEIASSAPLSTILLEYPSHATTAPPAEEEPEEAPEVEEEALATVPEEEAAPVVTPTEPLPEEVVTEPLPSGGEGEEGGSGEEESALEKSIRETRESEEREAEEAAAVKLPEIKHAFLIVLSEGGYETTFGAAGAAPYLSRVLPKKGLLIPNYYGVTGGVLANEIALLSGQGPTPETAANCPTYAPIVPGTVSATAGQVEGNGCVYADTVESLPTQLSEKGLTWRAYVENMEDGVDVGQPASCRKPTLGGPDTSPAPLPGDQYTTWRNPVVFFSKIAESEECGKLDVGFEALTRDLRSAKKTPTLSLIFADACHAGAEVECEPGAPTGARGETQLLKTLVPAILASPAYEEGGMILITSAQAPQAGERADPSGCCLAPAYPNLAPVPPTTTETEEVEPTKYSEESVLPTGGGGKVGLLMISPYVEAERVEELEYANHFTLLKTLEGMFGVEPLGYATEPTMPTLSPNLFRSGEEVEAILNRLPRSKGGSRGRAGRRRATS